MEVPGRMGAESPDFTRSCQKKRSRNFLRTLRAPSSTPLLVFVNVHCFWANTLSVCIIDKDGIFSSLKKCPFSYLQFWLSAMCLQVGTCVCRPKKDAGEEKLKLWRCCKMFHKVGPRNSRPLCSFVSHDPPLMSLQMKVPVLSPKRSQGGNPFLQGLPQEFVYEIKALSIRRTQSITELQWLIRGGKRSPIDWLDSLSLCLHWLKALNMSHPEFCPEVASLRFNSLERFSFPDCSRKVRPEHALTMLLQSEPLLAC